MKRLTDDQREALREYAEGFTGFGLLFLTVLLMAGIGG